MRRREVTESLAASERAGQYVHGETAKRWDVAAFVQRPRQARSPSIFTEKRCWQVMTICRSAVTRSRKAAGSACVLEQVVCTAMSLRIFLKSCTSTSFVLGASRQAEGRHEDLSNLVARPLIFNRQFD